MGFGRWDVTANNCIFRGLILNLGNNGLRFNTVNGGRVEGCWFGLNTAGTGLGTATDPAIDVLTSTNIVIGGNGCGLRNVIVGANSGGVDIQGGGTHTVQGNYFQTNAAGTAYVGPNPQQAIYLRSGTTGNTIGGAGNLRNIFNTGTGQIVHLNNASNNTIYGNYVNFNAAGTAVLNAGGPDHGIRIQNAASTNNIIRRNVIGSPGRSGINLQATTDITIDSNYIGINAAGTGEFGAGEHGCLFENGVTRVVFRGNTVANSVQYGIQATAPGAMGTAATNFYTITGNYIGTDAAASTATTFGNGRTGFFFDGGNVHTVTFTSNVISRNGDAGTGCTQNTQFSGVAFNASTTNITFTNNIIGTDLGQTSTQLGNYDNGVSLSAASTTVVFTGNTIVNNGIMRGNCGAGNSTNRQHGVQALGGAIGSITLTNNFFGTTAGGLVMGNGNAGVQLNGCCGQVGTISVSNNRFSNNSIGFFTSGGNTTGTIQNNTVTNNYDVLGNREAAGIMVKGSDGITIQNNTITNNHVGIGLRNDGASLGTAEPNNVFIYGNTITASAGTLPADGNFNMFVGHGIAVASGNTVLIGDVTNASRSNTITGNSGAGVMVTTNNSTLIRRNSIHCNTGKAIDLNFAPVIHAGRARGNASIPTPTILPANTIIPTHIDGQQNSGTLDVYGTGSGCKACPAQGDAQIWLAAHADAAIWGYDAPGDGPNLIGDASVTSNTATQTSEVSVCDFITPVELVSFSAQIHGPGSVLLSWVTAQEENNSHFLVQRSADGVNFETIGQVTGNGTTSSPSNYTYVDYSAFDGVSYYRLEQVDYDGASAPSDVRKVVLGDGSAFTAYPNPASDVLNVSGQFPSDAVTLQLYSNLGQLVANTTLGTEAGAFSTSFNVANLSKGVYILKAISANETATLKITIK